MGAWDETGSLTLGTAWKTVKAFLLESQYRYSLRLWATSVRFDGQPVWIGQVTRDIGVRFTPRTWNITTHLIDPDVDEARDYVLDGLRVAGRVARLGFNSGQLSHKSYMSDLNLWVKIYGDAS
jgi:hypothetical protein